MTTAAELAAGLRALADWLDSRPEFPVTSYPALNMALSAEQVTLATALLTDPTEHWLGSHPGADQMFGPLRLSVFHVSDEAVTRWRAVQAAGEQHVDYAATRDSQAAMAAVEARIAEGARS